LRGTTSTPHAGNIAETPVYKLPLTVKTVAIAVGPMAAKITAARYPGKVTQKTPIPGTIAAAFFKIYGNIVPDIKTVAGWTY
jgi:hypothetical protein